MSHVCYCSDAESIDCGESWCPYAGAVDDEPDTGDDE